MMFAVIEGQGDPRSTRRSVAVDYGDGESAGPFATGAARSNGIFGRIRVQPKDVRKKIKVLAGHMQFISQWPGRSSRSGGSSRDSRRSRRSSSRSGRRSITIITSRSCKHMIIISGSSISRCQ